MPLRQMSELCELEADRQEPRENQDLLEAEEFWDIEVEVLSLSSTSSSSSMSLEFSDNPEEVAAGVAPSPPQSPPCPCPSPEVMEAPPLSESQGGGSRSQDAEQQSTAEDPEDAESSRKQAVRLMKPELVKFLLLKYRAKEPTTKAEMLSSVIGEHQDHFPEIFREASLCMQRIFGIDVKEVGASDPSYVLVNSLGLTYDALASDGHRMPKNGLLILLLCVIVIEGDTAPERKVWRVLNEIGVHDGMEHYLFGEPRELITKVWVEEQYLEYRQVTGSDPARYEFLWGPRAHAETTRLEALEFIFRVSARNASSIPSLS